MTEPNGSIGPERERYTLVVEALADDAPAVVRLRRVIKALLRSYRFRLLSVTGPAASSGRMGRDE